MTRSCPKHPMPFFRPPYPFPPTYYHDSSSPSSMTRHPPPLLRLLLVYDLILLLVSLVYDFHSLPPTLCPSYFYLLHGPVPVLPPSLLLPYSPYLSSNHDYYYYTSSPTTSTTNAFSSSLRPSTPLPQLQHRNPISYSSSSSPWTTSISPPRHPHL